jgi:DeoR/GlpR family transcriptional regulator of sugar metabolism
MPSDGTPEAHEMIPAERRARIVESLEQRRSVRVSVLSEELGVSEMTIRRDLERLEQEGMLSRMHGGAILKRRMTEEPFYVASEREHSEEKRRIAQAAAAMIKPGETVFLSSGTTATQVLSHVDPELKARVVTHNVGAVSAAQRTSLDIVLLGGSYRPRSNTLGGSLTIETVGGFHASRFILGADGLSLDEGVTTPSLSLAGVERAMIRQTRGEIVVLADSSKVGAVGDVVICSLDTANVVILDDGVPPDVREEMELLGLRLIVV